MEQRDLLVVAVFSLSNAVWIGSTSRARNILPINWSWRRRPSFDLLRQFNGGQQIFIQRDAFECILPRSTSSVPRSFSASASRLISLLLTQIISSSSSFYFLGRHLANLRAVCSWSNSLKEANRSRLPGFVRNCTKSLLDSDLWRSLFYPYKSSYYYVATALF